MLQLAIAQRSVKTLLPYCTLTTRSATPSEILKSAKTDPDLARRYDQMALEEYEKQLGKIVNGSSVQQTWASFQDNYMVSTKTARTVITARRILKTLAFNGITDRQSNIPDAHRETYEWIFKEDEFGFVQWASQSNGAITEFTLLSSTLR